MEIKVNDVVYALMNSGIPNIPSEWSYCHSEDMIPCFKSLFCENQNLFYPSEIEIKIENLHYKDKVEKLLKEEIEKIFNSMKEQGNHGTGKRLYGCIGSVCINDNYISVKVYVMLYYDYLVFSPQSKLKKVSGVD